MGVEPRNLYFKRITRKIIGALKFKKYCFRTYENADSASVGLGWPEKTLHLAGGACGAGFGPGKLIECPIKSGILA